MTDQIEMPEESLVPRGAGPQLRLAREKMGLSVKDLAERTRISAPLIEKVEAGNFAGLASRAYAVGFARSLAREVGLDVEAIVALVRGELNTNVSAQTERRETYEPGDPARSPSRALVWFSIFAGVVLLVGLFVAARQLFWPAAEMPSLIEEQAAADAEMAAQAATTTPANAGGAVVFTARGAVWARIADAEGSRLFEGQMAQGQSFTVPADAVGPRIITGRPDLLAITVGGQAVPPLSTLPETISDMPVDAASLRARPAPVATPAAATSPAARATARLNAPAAPSRPVPVPEVPYTPPTISEPVLPAPGPTAAAE